MKIWVTAVGLLTLGTAVAAEPDCDSGARYSALAHERESLSELEEAIKFAQLGVESCPNYDSYEFLGELRAGAADREVRARAVDSFIAAYQVAESDQARARSAFQYARLLTQDGDPQNAYPLAVNAKVLDPSNAEVAALATELEQKIKTPTQKELTRGLWDSIYKPISLVASHPTGADGAGSGQPAPPSPVPPAASGPSLLIPIHFYTGNTIVEAEDRPNIAKLAEVLADPNQAKKHFTFVGHADVRGSESDNVSLSQRRAGAIYRAVVSLEPSLEGRIEAIGRGSSEPLDPARTEAAYRTNRRLQVLVK